MDVTSESLAMRFNIAASKVADELFESVIANDLKQLEFVLGIIDTFGDYLKLPSCDFDVELTLIKEKIVSVIDTQDVDGNTAIMIATASGYNDLAEELFRAGADLTIKNEKDEVVMDLTHDVDLLELFENADAIHEVEFNLRKLKVLKELNMLDYKC